MSSTSVHLRITGVVQGVGYRASLAACAMGHGVAGWVRNRRDGSVEAELHGSAGAVDAVIAWSRRGPPAARVDSVQVTPLAGDANPAPAGFEQRPTV